jgi:FHA domain
MLRFSTGESVTITEASGAVVGRDPAGDPDLPGAQVIRIDDRSLSRTHLSVGFDGVSVWIVDRHSTNGASFDIGGRQVSCTPGARTPVPPAARVVIGDVSFVVDVR